ncbi:MAG: hypothetical protein GXO39_07130 [Thermotogae bacterium]|nr:hypothetical protein [Thermotogota bacterium]
MRWIFAVALGTLLVACGSNSGKATDHSGTWETGFGNLQLTQVGDSLKGEFVGGNSGKFLGVIRNDTIFFTIKDASFSSEELEGFAQIRSAKTMKGKYRPKGTKVWEGTFYMMKR